MKKQKKNALYLQHKLPWETDWNDVADGDSVGCEKFLNILKPEPLHLITIEYRIIERKSMKLSKGEKTVIYPDCIMTGADIASYLKKLKRTE